MNDPQTPSAPDSVESTTEFAVNPLLASIKLPGETVRLPSGGVFYKSGELSPDTKNGEVHVYPMRAIDEILMRSPDKLISGEGIREVFAHCIPAVQDVSRMFAKDVDYLLVALRKVSYGVDFELRYTHSCNEAKEHTYMVNVDQFLQQSKALDPTQYRNSYHYTIESTGNKVLFRPLKFSHVLTMMEESINELSKPKDQQDIQQIENSLFSTLLESIDNVDNVTEKKHILQWLSKLPVREVRDLLNHIEKISDWGPKYVSTIQCRDCGEEVTVNVPVNPMNFFS